jgi:hypothetical protein
MNQGFHCSTCGQYHDGLPLAFGSPVPALFFDIPESEREARVMISSDQCVIDEKYFFVLGQLLIPIVGQENPFAWLCWVSLSQENFKRASDRWHTVGRESESPYFAWIQSALPYEQSTLNLKSSLITQPVGERPLIVLHEADHPMYREQANGVSLTHVQSLVERVLHTK